MDISNLSIKFYKTTHKVLPNSKLYIPMFTGPSGAFGTAGTGGNIPYGPFDPKPCYDQNPESDYVKTNFEKSDIATFIHYKDMWLHNTKNNKLYFSPLHKSCKTKIPSEVAGRPVLLYISYLHPPTFILYKHISYGVPELLYLVYAEKDGKIYAKWTENPLEATVFKYPHIKWEDWITPYYIDKDFWLTNSDIVDYFEYE